MNGSDLILNGQIVLEGTVLPHEWCMWAGDTCFSPRMVREALAELSGDVTVIVNSPGGDPMQGEAIRAALAGHDGAVDVLVTGLAASAASLMIMGADRIEMTAGSFLMIHDPSACMCGNADELRQEADMLDTLSATYAQVYAERAGQTPEAVRAMMAETVWMGPERAVELGFADATAAPAAEPSEPAPDLDLAAAMSAHTTAMSTLRMCAERATAQPEIPAGTATGPAGHPPAMSATTTETTMPPETQTPENDAGTQPPAVTMQAPEAPATPDTPAPAAPATPATTMQAPDQAAIDAAVIAERTRAQQIREMAAPYMAQGNLTQAQIEALVDEGTTVETAAVRMMTTMAQTQPIGAPAGARAPAQVAGGQGDPQTEGLIAAMMRDFNGPGAQFRGMRLRGLAMHLAGPQRGYSDMEAIRRGMMNTTMMGGAHGVSDFAYITTEVMNRTLMAEYDRRASSWTLVTGTPMTAADFREMHAVRFGGDFQLKPVKENGEYEEATLDDEAEGLKVERRGRTINITFEAVINDDMGAFTRIPRDFAMAARQMENKMVWTLFRDNAALKSDSTALFHADHNNLNAGGAGAISVARVGAARKNMWEQVAFGTEDPDDFLNITPDLLLHPPALERTARQFLQTTTPAKDEDVNPYKDELISHTVPNLGAAAGGTDTAWYLVSSDLPPISVARLEGYEAPMVQTIEGMNPDKVTMNARHIFGAAATEYRGAQKNNGA